ncbi:hypothetical protein WN51_14436 [Melipona quadrifasciata]|uniref:Uncharacterized protein n=1 Tax=Melipona quadrifasciata TaxID=166423 RepID=A0A0M8ZXY5_9HYME|nr:hypothetical protein WN51_14436 [Melipona quadrifasciata]
MLHSKATVALMRLKEMDRKYNIKRNEESKIQSNVSTESSLENSPWRSSQVKSKALNGKQDSSVLPITDAEKEIRPKISPKSRMEIKIPFIDKKNDESSSVNDSTTSKKSPKTSPKIRSITENDVSIEMQEKSERSKSKKYPKNLSNLKTNSRYKAQIPMIGSGDSPRSNDDFLVATVFSRRSNDSEIISEIISSVNETSLRKSSERSNEPEVIAAEDSVLLSNDAESTIEEVIKTSEEKSEIVTDQTNTINKDISIREVSLKEEEKATYEDDTFEEASSSIESSSSVDEKLKNNLVEDTVISGVKQIKITPHKQTEIAQRMMIDEDKDKEIVELIAPKRMQSTSECDIGLDEELSNYVKTTENVDETAPINLLKLSKQVTSTKKHVRRKKYRKLSNENTEERTDSSVASEHERLTERKENSLESFASTKSVKNGKKNQKETCSPIEHHKEKYINKIADGKLRTEIKDGSPERDLSEDKFLRETPKQSDVTSTLRKLNKDAINAIVRRNRIQTFVETPGKFRPCKNCGTIVKLPSAGATNAVDYDGDDSSLENFKTGKNPSHDQRIKQKAKCKKISKSSKSRKSNCDKIDGKHSRFDCRQTHRLRKQAAAIRLQQEREDIRNYLMELEHTRLEFAPGTMFSQLPAFKPLEFPKIAAFTKPDVESSKFKAKDEIAKLQERIVTIRQWLKDQYILYRDYSSLAQTVNSKYIPSSLEDAKRNGESNRVALPGSPSRDLILDGIEVAFGDVSFHRRSVDSSESRWLSSSGGCRVLEKKKKAVSNPNECNVTTPASDFLAEQEKISNNNLSDRISSSIETVKQRRKERTSAVGRRRREVNNKRREYLKANRVLVKGGERPEEKSGSSKSISIKEHLARLKKSLTAFQSKVHASIVTETRKSWQTSFVTTFPVYINPSTYQQRTTLSSQGMVLSM